VEPHVETPYVKTISCKIINHHFCYLARSANLPEGLYISLALISSFYFFTMSKAISVSTGLIFTIFSPNGRYLREFSCLGPIFTIPQIYPTCNKATVATFCGRSQY